MPYGFVSFFSSLTVTVNQTNVALKQLMTTLEQCRGDMDRVRQEHKEKFHETRDLVLKVCNHLTIFMRILRC